MLDTTVADAEEVPGAPAAPVSSQLTVTGIAILGSHPGSVGKAPFAQPDWLIYACSPHNVEHRKLPRVDQWFEVHDPIEDPTRAFGYLKAVSEMPFVWMRDKRALKSGNFPGAHAYPDKELQGTFEVQTIEVPTGTFQKVQTPQGVRAAELMEQRRVRVPNMDGMFCAYMFTSSIAYMLAKAIVDCEQQGIEQIGVFGVHQASETEFVYQRPGIQYFLSEAMRRGIKVSVPRESCLFDMPEWKW